MGHIVAKSGRLKALNRLDDSLRAYDDTEELKRRYVTRESPHNSDEWLVSKERNYLLLVTGRLASRLLGYFGGWRKPK